MTIVLYLVSSSPHPPILHPLAHELIPLLLLLHSRSNSGRPILSLPPKSRPPKLSRQDPRTMEGAALRKPCRRPPQIAVNWVQEKRTSARKRNVSKLICTNVICIHLGFCTKNAISVSCLLFFSFAFGGCSKRSTKGPAPNWGGFLCWNAALLGAGLSLRPRATCNATAKSEATLGSCLGGQPFWENCLG